MELYLLPEQRQKGYWYINMKLRAFHNKKSVKTLYVNRVKAHRSADEIVKGQYWIGGKGCAVGCTIHSSIHNAYETELGIPEWLARVEDAIFEGLPDSSAMSWPEKFLSSIKVGANLEKVKVPFLIYVLQRALKSVGKPEFDEKAFPYVGEVQKQARIAVKEMIRLHKKGEKDLSAARRTAEMVAGDAKRAAEGAAGSAITAAWNAGNAAWSAVWSVEESPEWGTNSVAWSVYNVMRSIIGANYKEYEKFADKLLKLLKECY
jgi:hypothetical protein